MHLSKEEQILSKHFNDMIHMSYHRGIPVFSQFTSLHEAELASQALDSFYGKQWREGEQMVSFGGYSDAERKILCFLPEHGKVTAEEDFPICCVRIAPANKRFCDSLNHRDYLGAIMNLGLERGQIGDKTVLVFCCLHRFCHHQVDSRGQVLYYARGAFLAGLFLNYGLGCVGRLGAFYHGCRFFRQFFPVFGRGFTASL